MRFLLLLLLPLLLSSCYRPVYGQKDFGMESSVQEKRLNRVEIAGIADRTGQILRNFLIDRMYVQGRPEKTDARLEIGLTTSEEDLGLQKDATTLRKRVTYTAKYTLIDSVTRKALTNGLARSFVSYDKIDSQYGALTSRESAGERAMKELADLIVTRILVYYSEPDNKPTPIVTLTPDSPTVK